MKSTTSKPFVAFEDNEDRFLPEGPRSITLQGREALMWVNIQTDVDALRGAIHLRFWDDGEEGLWYLRGRPGFVLPTDRPGIVIVGMEKEIGTLDLETNEFQALATIPDDNPRTIINDGEIVPGGKAIVFGTKDTQFKDPLGHLFLFTLEDSAITVLADKQICSNGKTFAVDEKGVVLYDIDSPTRTISRYRFDGAAREAMFDGIAIDLRNTDGFPDGMCSVGDGTVIVAFYNPSPVFAGRAIRFDLLSGKALEEWSTPAAPRVTCPLLVARPEGVKLILTTATEGMPVADFTASPQSGNLFLADTSFVACPACEIVKL